MAGQPSFSPLVPIYLPFVLAWRLASAVDVVQKGGSVIWRGREAETNKKGPTFQLFFLKEKQIYSAIHCRKRLLVDVICFTCLSLHKKDRTRKHV